MKTMEILKKNKFLIFGLFILSWVIFINIFPEGYVFAGATGGDSALALMHECQPDLILLDITMPGLDGFQVLELIRRKSQVPVIMLTGKGDITTLRESVEVGADDFIRKPFYPLELVARVKAKLRRAALQKNNSSRPLPSQSSFYLPRK